MFFQQRLLMRILVFLHLPWIIFNILGVNGIIVQTDMGKISGNLAITTLKRTKYYAFLSIPYAEPPVEKFRFQPPVEKKQFSGTWIPPRKGTSCVKIDVDNILSMRGSEDCLYLNIYSKASHKRMPVLVWIHGGFFFGGDANYETYGLDYFIDNDIVAVAINYRLGFLGFYHNNDDVAGNMGIKDQLMALKWIKRNIAQFGGDPERITIMGESAGAACVSYLVQSPQAVGLFQRAIMQSGNSLADWAIAREVSTSTEWINQGLKLMIRAVGYLRTGFLSSFFASFLPTLSMFWELANDPLEGLIFAPVIENRSRTAIIDERSHNTLLNCEQGSFVPIMIGHNSHEGEVLTNYSLVTRLVSNLYTAIYRLRTTALLPDNLAHTEMCSFLGKEVESYYDLQSHSEMGKFLGDVFFVIPTLQYIHLYSRCNDVYAYRFSYKNASHGDDLLYLFSNNKLSSDDDRAISNKMVRLWTNFIRFGDPTPNLYEFGGRWDTSDFENGYRFLNIDQDLQLLNLTTSPHWPDLQFWGYLEETCNEVLKDSINN